MSEIIYDEAACAEFIFNKLIQRGVAVSVDDIRSIIDLEFEYGQSIGLYPPEGEDNEIDTENEILVTIVKRNGEPYLKSELDPAPTLELLKKAIESVKEHI